jgi:uncharacterized membrane protein YedE/YeeE
LNTAAAINLSRNRYPVLIGGVLSALLFTLLMNTYGWRQSALFLVGLGAGVVLYHAAFGFTGAWRAVVNTGRGAGLRAQMIMLGVTVLIFTPLIAHGELWGISVRGNVYPLNLAVLSGAFIFGVGMQLGGGCASGTLFTAGGGNTRMVVTLAAFIAGSVIGAWHWSQWQNSPGFAAVSLQKDYGVVAAIVISMALFALIWFVSVVIEKRKHGQLAEKHSDNSTYSWFRGPWPLIAGALGLAAVNISTLMLAGRPWGITSGFALWGSKLMMSTGFDVTSWEYWQRPSYAAALDESVLSNTTSVMNIGILFGALIAAGLARKYSPTFKLPLRSLSAAIIGGLLMGYGARIAFGCNIGAFFSGVGSASLSGWLWFVAAFIGSIIGTRLRPRFGLD